MAMRRRHRSAMRRVALSIAICFFVAPAILPNFACLSQASPCTQVTFTGNYRKDAFLPYKLYQEADLPSPVHGGRIHAVATTPVPFQPPLRSVLVNGQQALHLPTSNPDFTFFDWAKAMSNPSTSQVWLSFHSRNSDWLDSNTALLEFNITDAKGNCILGSYAPTLESTNITWITPLEEAASGPQKWVAHIHNHDMSASSDVSAFTFDGKSVTTTPKLPVTLEPNGHLVLTFTSQTPKTRGELFTATLNGRVGNGARTPEVRYPIEVWPRSSDCPVPTVNSTTYASLSSHKIDTVYYSSGNFKKNCGQELVDVINNVSPKYDFYWFTDQQTPGQLNATARKYVSAVLVGDETDGHLDSNLRTGTNAAVQIAETTPDVLSYQGGKTNRYDGAYAGICDIQGMDFYIAGCAPTIVTVISTLPIQGSYAYLKNARNNHFPLPTMLYSQLYGSWDVEPNANEIGVELGYVLLAGAKGLMMFQSIEDDFNKEKWESSFVKDLLLSIANPTVRETLRSGDIGGFAFESSDKGDPIYSISSLTEVIRSPEYILIVIVNTDASGYNNLLCHVFVSDHWKIVDHVINHVKISISSDATVTQDDVNNMKEVSAGQLVAPSAVEVSLSGNTLTLSQIEVTGDEPVRLFLLPYTQAA